MCADITSVEVGYFKVEKSGLVEVLEYASCTINT